MKKEKKAPPKPDKRRSFHFACSDCKFETDIRAKNATEARDMALDKHDDHHVSSGSFCNAESYTITGD